MVYYFTSDVVQPPVTLFMGIDKYENEDLIKWGWPEDVWFHVDKYSSAHVYLRLQMGQTIDDIPGAVLEDAAQLVKANSIEGNKLNDVNVVYTMWSNLKKTQGMEVGQVGFHREKDVYKIRVAKRLNTIVNRLNKTKRSEEVNFRAEREQRDRNEREDKKKILREQKEKEKAEEKRKQEEAEMRSYNSLFSSSSMTSNTENTGYDSDDFMDDEQSVKKADSALNPAPSSVSTNCSPEKRNLSFCFNFDFDDVNSDVSSDSETADLQIDVSEVDNYEPPSRRKREEEETCSVLDEMEEEIERQLDAKAAKTNLTATNVKNILRHVITNEHVMAMVHKRLYDTEDDVVFEPKLTRAKAKELAAAQVNIPWPITPVKKASSEVQVLIEEELPEDSSDEEYNPEQDKQSDDEREVENSGNSDVECQPSTPASSDHSLNVEKSKSPDIRYDPEGIFKIPEVPHVPTEEESIGQRTRSKLCLSETSLEQIEQSFVPPDITTDMYDWDCELDEDWDNFLKEFTQPLTQEPTAEDDPEADPEYNILEDEESDLLDKEELRADKAVKVTRKELNNLIAELFEFTDTFSKQEQDTSRKKKSPDNSVSSNETSQLNDQSANVPASTEAELPKLLNCDQRKLLAVQMQQHVQLVTQYFLLAYMHPNLRANANTAKQNLISFKYLSTGENSAFNVVNLPEALKIVSEWEALFADTNFCDEFRTSMADEDTIKNIYNVNRWRYMPRFHPKLEELLVSSKVFMYPQLLPEVPLKIEVQTSYTRSPYLKSEENLIALGLEQFLPFVGSRPRKLKSQKHKLTDTVRLITEYLTPCRDPQGLVYYIHKRRFCKIPNPIKHYFEKGYAPRTIHYIPAECETKAPKDQPIEILPPRWRSYLSSKGQKMDLLKRKHLLNSYNDLLELAPKSYPRVPENHPLRNPVVNILPIILPNNQDVVETRKKLETQNKEQSEDKLVGSKDLPTISTPIKEKSLTNLSETKDVTAEEKLDPAKSEQGTSETDASNEKTLQKGTSISRKSSDAQKLPQLRKTTPRLAKTRSAQNMKLMAQALGSKNLSNCNSLKGREKSLSKETEKPSLHAKVDNEDEIAELMLASTTIKKDSLSRKKAKEAREIENIKRLLESENPLSEEERESKFAASYLQKLHLNVEPNKPETFRAVIKLYLDYNEKIEALNQSEPVSQTTTEAGKNEMAINLYRDVCEILRDYPELCSDFLLFLKPRQAAMIDKSVEYMMLKKMSEFVHVAQVYFAKQPSRIAKMMQAITQLASDPHTTLENVHAVIAPIFKGHPLVMDLFLQVLPTAKPPESLFAAHMFENLTCPLGPHDKNKIYAEDALELHENVELPGLPSQEDPYGGENCRCNCHTGDETNYKSTSEHCVSCGTRFLNGRIYLQTSEGLRPAKITFPGADDEQSENIARVSLKPTEKLFLPAPPSKQRRKSSKNENTEDLDKQCPPKSSPSKEEQCEKAVMKRKGVKSPTKTEQKKPLKRLANIEETIEKKRIRVSQCRSKREKKTDKKEEKKSEDEAKKRSVAEKEEKGEESKGLQLSEQGKMEREHEKNVEASSSTATNPWTRQEDMVLLQTIREEYSEKSLAAISRTLGNRTVDQVKERCQILLSLLEKMM